MIRRPAPRPCESCPYRRDVPSGIWHETEYARLARYDKPTGEQPMGAFLCHQDNGRLCGGWAGCHDMNESLGLRMATQTGLLPLNETEATRAYVSPVPLFSSGAEAAEHGMKDVEAPDDRAVKLGRKVLKNRGIIRR